MLLSRLPVNRLPLEPHHFAQAPRYFVLVGWSIGLICMGIFTITNAFLAPLAAIMLTLIAGLLLTGAIHEDGFADCCDGFGGGRDHESILAIMKDSRLGSYATLGLICLIGCKVSLLLDILWEKQALAFLTMHALGRLAPLVVICSADYISNGNSKMASGLQLSQPPLAGAFLLSLVILLMIFPASLAFALLALVLLSGLQASSYFRRKLGGYNGDCLGAAEQLTECAVLLLLALYY